MQNGRISILLLALCAFTSLLRAEEDRQPHVLAGTIENDLLYNPAPGDHQDRHYTSGVKLFYFDRGEPLPGWAKAFRLNKLNEHIPTFGFEPLMNNYAVVLGQSIYTPEDNSVTNLIANDRPYAGWLYTGFAIQRRGETDTLQTPVLENFELNIGVIGPEAQGEFAQNSIHSFRHLHTFNGWQNELRTEPAFLLKYGRAWKYVFNENTRQWCDAIPHITANLGTVAVSGSVGTTFRAGWHLSDDFGPQAIDSPMTMTEFTSHHGFSCYAFAGVDARAVGRNAFLDGNLYQSSHHVAKEVLVADLRYGAVLMWKHVELSWTFVTRTKEFDTQKGFDQFGSITAKLRWSF